MISFPKKSYFHLAEAQSILDIDAISLRSLLKKMSVKPLFSENGKKILLREDLVSLYSNFETEALDTIAKLDTIANVEPVLEVVSKSEEWSPAPELFEYREKFQEALSIISQIKSDRSEIWNNLQ